MQRLQRLLLYLTIITMPIQDCILGKSPLGYVGSNLSSIPLAIHGMIGVYLWLNRRRLTIPWHALVCTLYVICVSLIYLIVWGPVSHEGSVIYKMFSGGIVLVLWTYAIFGIDYTPSRSLKLATYIAFLVMLVGVALCDLNFLGLGVIGQSQIFHIAQDQGQGRWRGFSLEPSMFSATVVSLGVIATHLSETRKVRIILLLSTVCLLLLSQSKGGLLVLGISGFVLLFLKRPSFIRLIFGLILCSFVVSAMLYYIFQKATVVDFYQTSMTFATRISMAFWSVIVVLHHPFGVGLAGFYEALTIYLPTAIDWLDRVSPFPLNFGEVQDAVNGNMAIVPLDTKCFFLEYVAMFGFPFLVVYWQFSKRTIGALLERRQNLLLIAFIFILIGMSTYINGPALYVCFYLAGLSYREYRLLRQEHPFRKESKVLLLKKRMATIV